MWSLSRLTIHTRHTARGIIRNSKRENNYITVTPGTNYFLDAGLDAGKPKPTFPTPSRVTGLDAGRLNPTEDSLVTGLDAGRLNPKAEPLSLVAGLEGERLDPLPSLLGDRSLVAGLEAARLISPSSHPVRTLTRVNSAIRDRSGSSRSAVLPLLLPLLLLLFWLLVPTDGSCVS